MIIDLHAKQTHESFPLEFSPFIQLDSPAKIIVKYRASVPVDPDAIHIVSSGHVFVGPKKIPYRFDFKVFPTSFMIFAIALLL